MFYGLSALICLGAITKMLGFLVGNIRIENNISPYLYAIFITFPVFGFCFFAASSLAKSDLHKIRMYIVTCVLIAITLGSMTCTWLNNIIWYFLEMIPNYSKVHALYP